MKAKGSFFSQLGPARRRLAAWRQRRPHRAPIPQDLWSWIVPLARTHGVSRVSRALRLNYYGLKRRVASSPCRKDAGVGAPFVELKATPWEFSPACVVELEDGLGSKMTLRLSQGGGAEVLAWVQAFWSRRP